MILPPRPYQYTTTTSSSSAASSSAPSWSPIGASSNKNDSSDTTTSSRTGSGVQKEIPKEILKRTPKKPFSAYNIFYQVQRLRVLQYGPRILHRASSSHYSFPLSADEVQRAVVISKNKPRKRAHRKTKGMIGFHELNTFVTHEWKKIDALSRKILDHQVAIEKALYKEDLRRWKLMVKNAGAREEAAVTVAVIKLDAEASKEEKKSEVAAPLSVVAAHSLGCRGEGNNDDDIFLMRPIEEQHYDPYEGEGHDPLPLLEEYQYDEDLLSLFNVLSSFLCDGRENNNNNNQTPLFESSSSSSKLEEEALLQPLDDETMDSLFI